MPSVIAATPVNYRVIERARPRGDATDASLVHNHGGICIFVRSHLKTKLLDFPLYRSFELLPLYILNPAIKSLFLIVYRPGSKLPTTEFVEEFSDVLVHISSYAQCIVVGGVNVHLDDPIAPQVGPFLDLLSNFGLSEWVRQPTHSLGHGRGSTMTHSPPTYFTLIWSRVRPSTSQNSSTATTQR